MGAGDPPSTFSLTKSKVLMPICCRQFVDLRLSEVMEQCNDPAGLRDDDDDDDICFPWCEIKSIQICVVYIAFSNACRITDVYKYSSGYRTGHGC